MTSIVARHESRCPCCDAMIFEGDEITNIEGDWWHLECAREEGAYEDEY